MKRDNANSCPIPHHNSYNRGSSCPLQCRTCPRPCSTSEASEHSSSRAQKLFSSDHENRSDGLFIFYTSTLPLSHVLCVCVKPKDSCSSREEERSSHLSADNSHSYSPHTLSFSLSHTHNQPTCRPCLSSISPAHPPYSLSIFNPIHSALLTFFFFCRATHSVAAKGRSDRAHMSSSHGCFIY